MARFGLVVMATLFGTVTSLKTNATVVGSTCSVRQGDDAVGSDIAEGVVTSVVFEKLTFCGKGQFRMIEDECPSDPAGCKKSEGWEIIGANGGMSDCKHIDCPDKKCCVVFKCGGQFGDALC